MKTLTLAIFLFVIIIAGCGKDSSEIINVPPQVPVRDSIPTVPVLKPKLYIYEGLTFSAHSYYDQNQYFASGDTTFKTPKPRNQLDSIGFSNIDLLYIHDYNGYDPGFMDPHTASQQWYWNSDVYYFPWLAGSNKTEFFNTKLTEKEFNDAKTDQGLLTQFFKDTVRAEHDVFPPGRSIGGRIFNHLKKGQVWALLFHGSKRGLLFIRNDQDYGWPIFPIHGFRTRVDILREQ